MIIDVQRAFFDAAPRPFEAGSVVARIDSLARLARASGSRVVFVQHEEPASSVEFGGPGWQLEPGLGAQADDLYVRKKTCDSFLGSDLHAMLEARQVSHLVVCGYACEFCVDTTVRRAAALGYSVTLASDAHTTHDKPHASAAAIRAHENATLSQLTSFGPAILAVPSEQIAFAA